MTPPTPFRPQPHRLPLPWLPPDQLHAFAPEFQSTWGGLALGLAGVGAFLMSEALEVVWTTPEIYSILGLSPDDPEANRKWVEGIPAEDWAEGMTAFQAGRSVGAELSYLWRWRPQEGEEAVFTTKARGVAGPDGAFWGWLGITQKVGIQEGETRSLRNTTALLSRALRVGRMGAWRYDNMTEPGWWSEGVAEVMGLPPDTTPLTGLELKALLRPEDQARWKRTIKDAIARKAPFHFHWRYAPEGQEERSLLSVGELDHGPNGEVISTWGVTQDISPMQSALSALHESEAKFRALLDTALDTILLFDASGQCLFHNPRALELFGLNALALSGATLTGLLPKVAQALNSARSGHLNLMEAEAVRAHGQKVPVEVAASAWASGGQSYLTCVVRDLRERREVERLKGEFLSTVSHELRTPLNMVCGALDLLGSGLLPEAKRARMFEIANHNLDRLLRLVNDVLDLQSAEAGTLRMLMRAVDFDAIAQEAVAAAAPAAEAGKLKLEVQGGPLGTGVADGDRMHQVLLNLLGNACKFAPVGSTVHLVLEQEGAWVRFKVVDHGPGIPPEQAEHVFGRFIQLPNQGTKSSGGAGLGLAISRTLMAQHGGSLICEGTPGGGATFVASLPRDASQAQGLDPLEA